MALIWTSTSTAWVMLHGRQGNPRLFQYLMKHTKSLPVCGIILYCMKNQCVRYVRVLLDEKSIYYDELKWRLHGSLCVS